MSMHIPSKYDISIVFVCLGILMFVSFMITAEIQKRKNKLRYGIVSLLSIIGFFLIIIAATTFNLGYIFNFLIYIAGIVILSKDIISFTIKKKHTNEKSESIKIKSHWLGSILAYLMITKLKNTYK
jgi:predicted tellurium resistance membrane protein TerC